MIVLQRIWWACLLMAALSYGHSSVQAAENLVFISGAFRRSIPIADLEYLADSGEAKGLLSDVLRLTNQEPKQASKLLTASVRMPVVLVSRLLSTSIGEAMLERLAAIASPLHGAQNRGVPALRSAVVLGIDNSTSQLSPIRVLKTYPTENLAINLPAMMALLDQANSISELVRFFSEAPLDGLRGNQTIAPKS